jgi:hypothetical protein
MHMPVLVRAETADTSAARRTTMTYSCMQSMAHDLYSADHLVLSSCRHCADVLLISMSFLACRTHKRTLRSRPPTTRRSRRRCVSRVVVVGSLMALTVVFHGRNNQFVIHSHMQLPCVDALKLLSITLLSIALLSITSILTDTSSFTATSRTRGALWARLSTRSWARATHQHPIAARHCSGGARSYSQDQRGDTWRRDQVRRCGARRAGCGCFRRPLSG